MILSGLIRRVGVMASLRKNWKAQVLVRLATTDTNVTFIDDCVYAIIVSAFQGDPFNNPGVVSKLYFEYRTK